MTFKVIIPPKVSAQIEDICQSLSDHHSEEAGEQLREMIRQAIANLHYFPRRCARAPESDRSAIEIRQQLVSQYRILFIIIGENVQVLSVIHGAQMGPTPADLF